VGPWNHVLSTRLGPVTSVGRSTCGGTQWRRQAWSTGARAPWSLMHAPIFPYSLGKRIVYFLLPEAFYGLEYAENAIAAGALGDHDAPPDPLVGCGADTPPHTHPTQRLLALRFSRLWRLVRHAPPPDTKSWRRHWWDRLGNACS